MNALLFSLWFFLPAGLANGAPVLASKLPFLKKFKTPIDYGAHYRGKRILGNNKTWRGLLAGILTAIITVVIQVYIYNHWSFVRDISLIDYSSLNPWLLGFLLGFGALFGDAAESFIKRQVDVASGESWFPFDQLDYVVGGLFFSSLVVSLSFRYYVLIAIVWFCLHLLSVYGGYLIGWRDKPI